MNNLIIKQQGVVLLVALIALVVMSLGALAIVRSVDTNGLIAGNIAFKQAATSAGDFALDGVATFISSKDGTTVSTDANQYLNNSHATDSSGYYATVYIPGPTASPTTMFNIGDETSWATAAKVGTLTNATLTASGLTVNYVIERMCSTNAATPISTNCLFAAAATNSNSSGGSTITPAPSTAGGAPLYRITARIAGPQNTVSYIQAFTD
jgi:Tfp pilus assembly protein PilX